MSLRSRPVERALAGEILPPGDKSISHRAVILGSIAHGDTRVAGWLDAADTRATLNACRALGATIDEHRDDAGRLQLVIHGNGAASLHAPAQPLDLGNSGTGVRLLMGLLAGLPFTTQLTGDHSLQRRPMGRVIQPLAQMGARIDSDEHRLPVTVHGGQLQGITYASPIASAQVKSAILLAGLSANGETIISEPALSRDHSERMLQDFGVQVQRNGLQISIHGGCQLRGCDLTVPADFSSAAFFLVAGSIIPGSQITLRNVGLNETRRGLLDVLQMMGADIQIRPVGQGAEPIADLTVRATRLHGIDVPVDKVVSMIDEFPILMAAAAVAEGTTRIRGAEELRVKESDRIAVMCRGLAHLGIEVQETPDGADIIGGIPGGGHVDANDDHRCAMSFAVLGACARDAVTIDGSAYIATSYPGFRDDFILLGGRLEDTE